MSKLSLGKLKQQAYYSLHLEPALTELFQVRLNTTLFQVIIIYQEQF